MRIDVFTIFPGLIKDFAGESLLGRAQRNGLLELHAHDLRSGSVDKHRTVDDTAFGGGPGMVLAPDPVFRAVEATDCPRPLYLMSPGGRRFDQQMAGEMSATPGFSLLCGRYEGVDQRVIDNLCDGEISLGDFVLGGGEVAALAIIEAVTRLVPGVMGNSSSATSESFQEPLLEYPQYTRPADFRGWQVPAVLQSGNHALIAEWRTAAALARTLRERPDLIEKRGGLTVADRDLLAKHGFAE